MADKKNINARIVMKKDSSDNWDKAKNFIPMDGEPIIVSDNKKKFKIGDGKTVAKDLPYLLDVIPVTEGEGEKSIIIGDGKASGDYSVAGGTTDGDVIKDLAGSLITPTLSEPEASGNMSLAFGANVKSTSIGSIALGYDSMAGVKGYYYHDIAFNNDGSAKIYLAKTQTLDAISTSSSAFKSDLEAHLLLGSDTTVANLGWKAGDYISIVNDHKFPFCSQITNVAVESRTFTKSIIISTLTATVDCIVVTVDSLPFTAVDEPTIKLPDDKTIFAISRIWDDTYKRYDVTLRNGAIELGWGAIAIGSSNQALGSFSSATGYNNTAVGDFGSAEGRGTLAGYGAHSEGYRTEAKGTYSHTEGHTSIASGEAAHSEGKDTEASGLGAHAQNVGTAASADAATAMGAFTQATANNAVSMGHTTIASGNAALAGGKMTIAEGHASLAFGFANTEGNIKASGKGSIAMGDGLGKIEASGEGAVAIGLAQAEKTLTASGYGALALGVNTAASGAAATSTGSNTTASGGNSFATGHTTEAKGNAAFAEGRQSIAYGQTSHAEGYKTKAGTEDGNVEYESAHAEGYQTTAIGIGAHTEGSNTEATANYSHAEGLYAVASGARSHAEGSYSVASGKGAHAEGSSSIASGDFSHAEGQAVNYNDSSWSTTASGAASHAEGVGTIASGDGTHSEGMMTKAEGYGSHAEGRETIAYGKYSHAEGASTKTGGEDETNELIAGSQNTAGSYAHAEGNATIAQGVASHSEGINTFAKGKAAHAEGYRTIASSEHSHAEGSTTIASGNHSHAEGCQTIASGIQSHAEGGFTIASGMCSHAGGSSSYAEHEGSFVHGQLLRTGKSTQAVFGKNNIVDYDAAFVIGNGENDNNRSNLFTVGSDDNGNYITLGDDKIYEGNFGGGRSYHITTDAEKKTFIANDIENNIASGNYATALGGGAQAIGNYSFAVGAAVSSKPVKAEGLYSVAMGAGTYAKGGASTALGAYSTAEGSNSLAAGHTCYAKGNSAIALGKEARAIANYQTVVGMYNAEDSTAAFVVGAGTSSARENAFTAGKDSTAAYITVGDKKFYALDLDGGGAAADSKISAHNTDISAHNDVRVLITNLTTRLNALADSDDVTLDQMSEIVAYIKANKSLIDSITTDKVNVADIVNNLTTNVANKPLSAAQGVALKALIDNIKGFSGSYNDLTNKPTIPTVNNATLTIQKNGTNVATFTANSSTNATANITVPTKLSELTNDSGYTKNTGTVTSVKVGNTSYNPSSGVISLPAYPTSLPANGGTATKATQDGNGNVITSTYATKAELQNMNALPSVTSTDNGKILRVVDGNWSIVALDVYKGEVM